ncbi:MAG: acetyl-CoA carboxylase carboxyltransferase subunit alpha [Deltaproteobacteria bacterium]|nr:acetyl-CoA carboxylase carboxyltransferase subunit alpha [Deltaproteobacteria bacterium]
MSRELDFERPILELERQIEELRRIAAGLDRLSSIVAAEPDPSEGNGAGASSATISRSEESLDGEIGRLERRARQLQEQIFSALTRWQIVQLSRHPERPYLVDYVQRLCTCFEELHGDRCFGDDGAIIGGLARFDNQPLMVIGHQKGRNTKENMRCNFGMARPEGYRKAMRLMRLAERFSLPIVTLIDTPGAYPGIDAEERGQALAIAESLEAMAGLSVPVIALVTGEGGSGGALAIGVANRVLMLEYATYSVISPEACSSILFKDASHAERAADALRLTAPDLLALGVIDEVVNEPPGGAHRDPEVAASSIAEALRRHLKALGQLTPAELRSGRYERFRRLGSVVEGPQSRRVSSDPPPLGYGADNERWGGA